MARPYNFLVLCRCHLQYLVPPWDTIPATLTGWFQLPVFSLFLRDFEGIVRVTVPSLAVAHIVFAFVARAVGRTNITRRASTASREIRG